MKKIVRLIIISLMLLGNNVNAQLQLPYASNFDDAASIAGWTHYALLGTDDWALGMPAKPNMHSTVSGSNAWATNLNGNFTAPSLMCLETPSFNFSGSTRYKLSFFHQYYTDLQNYFGNGGNIEYSIDNGQNWILLKGTSSQNNQWYNVSTCSGLNSQSGWSSNKFTNTNFIFSSHDLTFLNGNANVKFRFKFGAAYGYPVNEGWVIDNFSIDEISLNVSAVQPEPFHATKRCTTFPVNLTLSYYGSYPLAFINKAEYYISKDQLIDAGDVLLGTLSRSITQSQAWNTTLPMPANISAGTHFILCRMDADNLLKESSETDNVNTALLIIDSIYNTPIVSSLDDSTSIWEKRGNLDWQLKTLNIPYLDGAHSGKLVWSIYQGLNKNYLETPDLDLSQPDSVSLSFWYRVTESFSGPYNTTIQYKEGCNGAYKNLADIPKMRDNTWDFFNVTIPKSVDLNDVQLRIYSGSVYYATSKVNIVLDDIYVGKTEPDLSIERKTPLSISSSVPGSVKYYLNNSGRAAANASKTKFYWSVDSIYDASDILLGINQEPAFTDTARIWRTFNYTKPTSAPGTYYIIYFLDFENRVSEMREYNNTGYYTLIQQTAMTVPYFNNFETQITGWSHTATFGTDDWEWSGPKNKQAHTNTFSGTKCWITNDAGPVTPLSRMHLYTPVFDFSSSQKPVMEFDMNFHGTNMNGVCSCSQSFMNMSYSIDGGSTWKILDTTSQSFTRWYYTVTYDSYAGIDVMRWPNATKMMLTDNEPGFAEYASYNSRDTKRTSRYIIDLTFLAGKQNVRFRYNLGSTEVDPEGLPSEGALIDNFSIRESFTDLVVEQRKNLLISSLNQKVKFFMNIENTGNYISKPGIIKYYLSNNTVLDGADYALGEEAVPAIRPDMSYYINTMFAAPSNLSTYKYLIFVADASNTTIEINETNNTGYWELGLDGIKTFPYLNDFNDSIVNGWHNYTLDRYGIQVKNTFRIRNMRTPSEPETVQALKFVSGEMFTETISESTNRDYIPIWYLESPAFDFSGMDTISLSFDKKVVSAVNYDGGNFEFSTDGGNTWTVLTQEHGASTNWYQTYYKLYGLFNEPGWNGVASENALAFKPVKIDITFLKDQAHVVFRFKFKSHNYFYGLQGIRLDNFRVFAATKDFDYIANDRDVAVPAINTATTVQIEYSISNAGLQNGPTTTTNFYWSTDNILDANDILMKSVIQDGIAANQTGIFETTLTSPARNANQQYYILYKTDADNILAEMNETDNIGSFKIDIDNITTGIDVITDNSISLYENNKTVYIYNPDKNNTAYTLSILNMLGQVVFTKDIILQQGMNQFVLPNNIHPGLYIMNISNADSSDQLKFVLN